MDRGVIATAEELYAARHYPSVIAVCTDALHDEPECVELRIIRARALMKLRRDLDAQADLRDIIRLSPTCADAYYLLGELAARREENESAAIFFREALRLRPGDRDATEWLQIIDAQLRAVTRKPSARRGDVDRFLDANTAVRVARGTRPPSQAEPALAAGSLDEPLPDADEPTRPDPRPTATRGPLPELPGFGDYLVETGVLTRERLRAAQAYQRSMRVALSTAIVTLGLATPQRIEWAVVSHQAAQPQRRIR